MKNYLKELLKRKDLMLYLAFSRLKGQHKNSVLGYLWWFLDPLLNIVIYYFVVVTLFRSGGGNDYGMYLVVGMIVWRWGAVTVTNASRSIVSEAGIIGQVYQPKVIFPAGAVLTQVIHMVFGMAVIAVFMVFFRVVPVIELLWLPVVVFLQLVFMLAVALPVAYLTVFIRDFDNILQHLMRLWFFATPVIWRESLVPERWNWLLVVNPMAYFVRSYRNIFIYNTPPNIDILCLIGLVSAVWIFLMLYYYTQNEHRIIKAL